MFERCESLYKLSNARFINVAYNLKIEIFIGLEYSLLFISTVESLELSGRPFDVLKSFCHPAVFNTAITRSQSLVVAVGNPLVLMMSEATIDEPKWCWREFVLRCMAKNTFIVSDNLENPNDKVRDQFQRILESRQPLGRYMK